VNGSIAAYSPTSPVVLLSLTVMLVSVIVAGYVMARVRARGTMRVVAWALLVVGTAAVERLCAREPAGVRMLALVACALLFMKVIVFLEEQIRGMQPLPPGRWLGFTLGWLGMQPRLFASVEKGPLPGAGALMRRGIAHLASGAMLVALARVVWTETRAPMLATLLLLPGLSLVVHFGVCNVLAGVWRRRGVPCQALFRAPLRSENLGEFWSRRWNLAFSEMTAIAVYRPLAASVGRGPALLAGFAMSGFLHEMAISVPVRAGFGLPFLYFLMHGVLVLIEKSLARAGYPLEGWGGRAWAFFWLVAPLPILFHRPFLAGVIWPLIGIE
jgi:alginate O-acetyltransferase complex protein AlgI